MEEKESERETVCLIFCYLVCCSKTKCLMFMCLSVSISVSMYQKAFQIGLYWPHTNTVHKSEAMHLLHDLTSPRWTEVGGAEDLSLDEEGYVDADIILGAPPRQKVCERDNFCNGYQ